MSEETTTGPVARSPIRPPVPVCVVDGWECSAISSTAALTLTDVTPLAKVSIKASVKASGPAPAGGGTEQAVGVPFRRARRGDDGALVVGSGPGEWLVLGRTGSAGRLIEHWRRATAGSGEPVTVLDLTHGRALVRLTGERAADALSTVCGIDLRDAATPDGAAFRSSVAGLVTDVVRDDVSTRPSYLLHCERSSGQYLFDALLQAGAAYDVGIAGFAG